LREFMYINVKLREDIGYVSSIDELELMMAKNNLVYVHVVS